MTPDTALFAPSATDAVERKLVAVGWDTIVIVRGSDTDSLPSNVSLMQTDGRGFIVFDDLFQRASAYDSSGVLQWRSRDHELSRVRDMKLARNGDVVLTDLERREIVFLSRQDGSVRARWPDSLAGPADQLAPQPNGSVVVFSTGEETPFRVLNGSAKPTYHEFPWGGFVRLHEVARQGRIGVDPASGKWVFAFTFGDGWLAFNGQDTVPLRGRNVEHTSFPAVVVDSSRGQRRTRVVRSAFAALDVAVNEDIVTIRFGGTTSQQGRILDRYEFGSGKYVGSIVLPGAPVAWAMDGDRVVVFGKQPHREVAVLRLRFGGSTDVVSETKQ